MVKSRMERDFFLQDVLDVAPALLGKLLVRKFEDGREIRARVTEVEAYRGGEDLACHASRGRTSRTEVMFRPGGLVYVYLIYGMYWMLNFVTGEKDLPQAVLIRGIRLENREDLVFDGPGKLSRHLQIGREFYGEDLTVSPRLWLEDHAFQPAVRTGPRIGIDYAGEPWASKPWRFLTEE